MKYNKLYTLQVVCTQAVETAVLRQANSGQVWQMEHTNHSWYEQTNSVS